MLEKATVNLTGLPVELKKEKLPDPLRLVE
jgi:hypothetical protein